MNSARLAIAVLLFVFFLLFQSTYAQTVMVNRKAIRSIVEDWNSAHNDGNTARLKNLYAPKLIFYGQNLGVAKCLYKKEVLFSKFPAFHQIIVDDALNLTAYGAGVIRCDFAKEVTFDGRTTKQYSAYLVLKQTDAGYIITGESDPASDRDRRYKLNLGAKLNILDTDGPDTVGILSGGARQFVNIAIWIITILGVCLALRHLWQRLRPESGDLAVSPLLKRSDGAETRRSAHDKATPSSPRVYDRSVVNRVNLINAAQACIQEIHKEDERDDDIEADGLTSWEKGYEFEQFTVDKLAEQADFFRLSIWRSDKRTKKGNYAESNKLPDLECDFHYPNVFSRRHPQYFTRRFAIECKFRSRDFNNGIIKVCKLKTLNRYREYQTVNNLKVYIYIGFRGTPSAPEETFLVPLDGISDRFIHLRDLENYRRTVNAKFYFDPESFTFN